jgi:hypothetical protein
MDLEQFKRRLPPQLRWMCDMDYLHKLTDEERVWLLTVAETEYRGTAKPDDASPMTRDQQRAAANYVRGQAGDRRPDLMNFSEGYRERRVPLDDVSEGEIHRALEETRGEEDDV